ncbi:hypothetical protein Pmani_018636 [Petrolisthes manimaculis]|uniref:Uncharacterized protein n=1 Tax=Petrolisthes manimaculis TaxID=1843537 RepID=A0AAE1PK10_9EUCA|nr:hypothetical protein Pmani_018636 [Petrolisthes manimaculis]
MDRSVGEEMVGGRRDKVEEGGAVVERTRCYVGLCFREHVPLIANTSRYLLPPANTCHSASTLPLYLSKCHFHLPGIASVIAVSHLTPPSI